MKTKKIAKFIGKRYKSISEIPVSWEVKEKVMRLDAENLALALHEIIHFYTSINSEIYNIGLQALEQIQDEELHDKFFS